jgi:hypothetical protein
MFRYIEKVNKGKDEEGWFDDVFRYELDDENWRPTYILYKLTSIKLAKCKIIISSMFHYIKK